jgi:GNAT superfamily N-acetyltransferase
MSASPTTSPFTLVDRPLLPDEAHQVSAAIRETANILGYSPQELLKIPSCLIAEAGDGGFAGVCAIKRYSPKCSEIVFILILPDYRRQGIGSALFREAFRRLREENQTILCISREPSILRLMEEMEMRFVSEWRMPPLVQLAKFRHYANLYRFRESFRKAPMYRGQPPFRYALKDG